MPKSSSPKKSSPKKSSPKRSKDTSPKKKGVKGKKEKSPKKIDLNELESKNAPITHVIFDLDGVLLNSARYFEIFVNRLFLPYGQYLSLSLKRRLRNRKIEGVAKLLIRELNLPMTRKEFINDYKELFPTMIKNSELKEGVSRLIEYFRKHQMPMAVVTDSTEENYKYKISRHKLIFDKISVAVCYGSDSEVKMGRPQPFLYEVAASRFKEKAPNGPYNILVFEDTIDGVDAALAARMKVVWIADSIIDASLHNFNQDLMVIDRLESFQPQLWRLPYLSELYAL